MRFTVTKEIGFDAGHRVPLHGSKCRNPHGHRYRVVAEVSGELSEEGPSTGMVIDFGDLKRILQEQVHDPFDHGFIVWEGDQYLRDVLLNNPEDDEPAWKVIVVDYHPTAENLAAHIYGIIEDQLPYPLMLESVTVWETPTSSAKVS